MRIAALPVVGAIGVALAALLVAEIRQDKAQSATRAVVASAPALVTPGNGAPPAIPLAASVDAILRRPLFNTDRRPVAQAAAETGGRPAAGLPRLAGILVTPSGRTAIFAGPDGGKPFVVVENGRIGAYVVSRIEGGTVTVTGPDGVRQIRPSFASGAEASANGAQQTPDAGRQVPGQSVSILDLIRNPSNIPFPAAPQK